MKKRLCLLVICLLLILTTGCSQAFPQTPGATAADASRSADSGSITAGESTDGGSATTRESDDSGSATTGEPADGGSATTGESANDGSMTAREPAGDGSTAAKEPADGASTTAKEPDNGGSMTTDEPTDNGSTAAKEPDGGASITELPENRDQSAAVGPVNSGGTNPDAANGGSGAAKELSEDESYTTKEDVALYLHLYGHLPPNFITKKEAEKLGWKGGSLEPYAPGMCIGGNYFGNYEELLPVEEGRSYTECDIDTLGAEKRGAKRIVFSNDGLIYYTEDHYESFELLYGNADADP